MRKLKQLITVSQYMKLGDTAQDKPDLMALDDNGELWHGKLETTGDGRKVIDWTPVNTPKDGAAYSEPQLSRFDKWELEANEILQADADASGEDVPIAAQDEADTVGTSGEAERSSGVDLEDGEGTDPDQ
jgi:hypothetical protein